MLDIEISRAEWNHGYANICCIAIPKFMLKNNSFYFLAIFANFPCKIEKFELKSCRCGHFRDRVLLSGKPLKNIL